jgi:hypothetical protein
MTAQALPAGNEVLSDEIVVQVIDITTGREIAWGGNVVEKLSDRLKDVQTAIVAGVHAVSQGLDRLPTPTDWQLAELSASFGVTLAAAAGVVLSKASAEATFEVTVTFKRA